MCLISAAETEGHAMQRRNLCKVNDGLIIRILIIAINPTDYCRERYIYFQAVGRILTVKRE